METRPGRKTVRGITAGLVTGAALWWGFTALAGRAPEPVKTVYVPTPPPAITVVDSLRRGQTLAEVFGSYGLTGLEIMQVVEKIREFHSPRQLRPGMVVHFAMRPRQTPMRISLQLDPDRTLHLFPEEEGEGAWDARLDSVEVTRDTILLSGLVESNLYDARLAGDIDRLAPGERNDIVFRISQIFQWQIDFWRDIRRDDAYRVAMAREVRPDGTIRSARVLAAEFRNGDRHLTAVRFQPDETSPVEFYDEEGEALRGQFLLAPLDLARVTSGFSLHRYHPILRVRRPHLGIDYGATSGTPVRATGSGVVIRAGRWGGYGRMVGVRHANNLRTRYAHLSGIARGIRGGVRVEQGEVIGRVGASGLATAPHLHYEFLRNGHHVNPARLQFPRAEPVAAELRPLFDGMRNAALALLDRIGLPLPIETGVLAED
ncbi:MAG: M23 family metallopeptidase [Gemmatimonadota bacterium]